MKAAHYHSRVAAHQRTPSAVCSVILPQKICVNLDSELHGRRIDKSHVTTLSLSCLFSSWLGLPSEVLRTVYYSYLSFDIVLRKGEELLYFLGVPTKNVIARMK